MSDQSERIEGIVVQQELLLPAEVESQTPIQPHGHDVTEPSVSSQETSPKISTDAGSNTATLAQPLASDFWIAQADAKPHVQADESDEEEDEPDEEEQAKPKASDDVVQDAAPVETSSDEGLLVADALSDTGDVGFSISTMGWTGIGLGLIGIAAAAGGGSSTPPPDAPSVALDTDTGKAADDGITTVATLSVTGLSVEAAATWEYSTDGGTNWVAGQGSAITLTDAGSFVVVVRQTVGDQVSESSASVAVTLDLSAATLDGLVSSSADQTIVLNYSETLDDTSSPAASAFTVRQGGVELAVDGVVVSGSTVTLSITGLASGSLQVAYAVPSEGAGLQDLAGNSAGGFSQIVVSDGYIRGAKVYLDANGDGVGDESELLEGVTSNSAGEILVEGDAAAGALIIVGGVNTDTGAVNTLTLSAPAGYSVVNPLSTLVAQVIKSADPDAVAPTEAEAEALVATALGLTLADGESLSSYDPLSDTSEAALANRIVTAQIATILVTAATASEDAGAGEAAEAAVLNNLATIISSATEGTPVILDAATVASVLTDAEGTSLVSAEQLTAIQTSVETLETATSIEAVVTAQAEATDNVSAAAPSLALVLESDSGASASDGLTNVVAPSVQVSFDTTSLDGTAVIVGDRVEVLDAADGSVLATAIVTSADLASGAMTLTSLALNDGSVSLVARVTDIAGNLSANAAVSVDLVIDTIPAAITSASAAQVDENSAAPQVVYTAVATDAGGGITFSLADGANDGLSIDAGTGAVSLATSPDFETLSSYSFTVLATDGAGNVSEKAVELAVTNFDDTAPTITSGATATPIAENSGAGQVIYTAVADDTADISAGVTFSLAAGSDAGLAIDGATGEVTLAADPDEETQASYSFTVTATDAAGNASDQAVGLAVSDVDEVAPTITSSATGLVVEDSGANRVVYTVSADDSGDITTNVLVYSLAAGSDDALSINAETGQITLSDNPKKDVQDTYSMTVVATDSEGNASELSVSLTVDVAPLISSSLTPNVDENVTELGVYTVVASDAGDPDAVISYGIKEGGDPALSIDSATGVVTLAASPDYEAQSSYSFVATASDQESNMSESAITLSVNDLDEVAPTITSGATATSIAENSGAGQVIYTAVADDTADISAGVTFSLAAGSDAGLAIDGATGEVTLAADPDEETQASYSFTVTATDAAGNASDQAVGLAVSDVDEVAPTITSSATGLVVEDSGANRVVYTVSADDSGDITTNVLVYSLAAGSDDALSINAETGQITLSDNPKKDVQDTYSMTVVATDSEGNASELSVSLTVDVAPLISSSLTPNVDENVTELGVYTVVASDAGDPDAVISYGIKEGGDPALSIDSATGVVTLAASPDYEAQSSYSFVATASDQESNMSESAITLSVNDLDEVAPTITSGATATSIAENSGAGQVIYTAVADDTADISAGVTFSLAAGSDAGLAIDGATGEVTLAADPDEETQASYSFTVTATDAAGNASDQAVTLSITDLDDTTPTMTSAATGTVLDYQSLLYTAAADDSTDVSAGVTYSLQADTGDASLLTIDGTTGTVSLASGVTSNGVKSSYGFTVLASDGVTAAATQAVTIAVTAPTVVSGPGMVTQGGLTPSLVANDDGTSTLSVALDSGQVANYPDGIENVDFTLTYNVSEVGLITDNEIEFPGGTAWRIRALMARWVLRYLVPT